MAQALWNEVRSLLELTNDGPDAGSMVLRTVLVYVFTLAIVRLGSRRLLAKPSAFDIIVAIMVGSIMSRAINGSAPFVPTLVAGAALLALHWALATLAFHTSWAGRLVKGRRIALIRDGEILHEGMRRASLTHDDLLEALRLQVRDEDPSKVAAAYMERSGEISVIPRKA